MVVLKLNYRILMFLSKHIFICIFVIINRSRKILVTKHGKYLRKRCISYDILFSCVQLTKIKYLHSQLVKSHWSRLIISADDSNNYTSFLFLDSESYKRALYIIECSTTDIKRRMCKQMLKFNDTKTEVLVIITPKHKDCFWHESIGIADSLIQPSEFT